MRNLGNVWVVILVLSLPGFMNIFAQDKALDFTLTDINGTEWTLFDELAKGKTVLIDFYYAECVPCKTLTPQLVTLNSEYQNSGLQVIGISNRDDNEKLKTFEEAYGVNYPSGGVEGMGDDITNDYMNYFSFLAWPTYAVVCPDTSMAWDIRPVSEGLPELREKVDLCLGGSSGAHINPKDKNPLSGVKVIWQQGALNIQVDFEFKGEFVLSLHTLKGTLVKEIRWNQGLNALVSVPLPNLAQGLYIVSIDAGDKKIVNQLLNLMGLL